MQKATLEEYDFSSYVGFTVTLHGIEGFRCDQCGWETISGGLINLVMTHTVIQIAQQPRRVNGPEAKFLRQTIGATQTELGTRMGTNRVTVAKWETDAQTISGRNDFILKVLVLSHLIAERLIPASFAHEVMATVRAVHSEPPSETTKVDVSGPEVCRWARELESGPKRAIAG